MTQEDDCLLKNCKYRNTSSPTALNDIYPIVLDKKKRGLIDKDSDLAEKILFLRNNLQCKYGTNNYVYFNNRIAKIDKIYIHRIEDNNIGYYYRIKYISHLGQIQGNGMSKNNNNCENNYEFEYGFAFEEELDKGLIEEWRYQPEKENEECLSVMRCILS